MSAITPVSTDADTAVAEPYPPTAEEDRLFDSLDALRQEHTNLLKTFYAQGTSAAVLDSVKAFLKRGELSGKNFDRSDERLEAQRILDQWATVLMKSGHDEIDATLADFEGQDLSEKACPYVGLKPFGEADHGFFFGRELLVKQAVSVLAETDFLAVLGLSGSGKSSLVLGGILPDLRKGALPSSSSWNYVPPMVPGAEPLQNMVATFRAGAPGLIPSEFEAASLVEQPNLLAEAVQAGAGERSVLLVVDQFEEVFTLCDDPKIREVFASALLAFIDKAPARHKLILTMRSDFEPRLASLPKLQDRFIEHQTVLRATGLTRNELRAAIEGPAKAVGLHFHKEVIDALLKDVGDELAALPLLQFTLRKLWETKRYDRITLADYNSIGGAKGALARSADQFYEGLIPQDQAIAQRILLRMVRLGEGLEVTSARIRYSSLYELGYDRNRVDSVVQRLEQNGLIRITSGTKPGDEQLEVAHEAMVRNWRRFVRWLEQDRASLLIRRRLDDKTLEWLRLGGGTSGLLDQVQLEEAQEWLDTTSAIALGFHPSLPLLVQKSKEAIDAAEQEKEAAKQALRDQTRIAEEQQRYREFAEREFENEQRLWQAQGATRRMRRIARLAFFENLALGIAFILFIYCRHNDTATTIAAALAILGYSLGLVVFILAVPAVLKVRQVFRIFRWRSKASRRPSRI